MLLFNVADSTHSFHSFEFWQPFHKLLVMQDSNALVVQMTIPSMLEISGIFSCDLKTV
jgi:hypothetical protein